MPFTLDITSLLIGTALGAAAVYVFLSRRLSSTESEKNILAEKLTQQKDALDTQRQNIEALEQKFALQFENLANRIFDEKTGKFKKESTDSIAQLLNPLREKIAEFQKKVEDSSKEQFSLKNEIRNIVVMNEKMTEQTANLTRALKGDVKAQGSWGEVILEKILDMAGLRKDIDYVVQGADLGLKHIEDGSHLKPDVIVMLPEDKHVIIDSKVSLTAYERYCAAEDDAARAIALKDFITSIKSHVQGLEQRRYQDTSKLGTPDFVLMFMPIEGAYSLAMQNDASLYSFAWDKKIAIVCPSTLFVSLRTIASLWRIELQNRNALEIARQGGNLYDKVVSFVEDMQDIGVKLGSTQKVYDEAFKKLSTGTGNLIKRTEDIRALGLKTAKKMPKELADEGDNPLKIAENG